MKHNKKREYEQAPLGFVWVEGEERGRVFRLEKWGKRSKAFLTEKKEEMNREKGEEGGRKATTLANHQGPYGWFPGGKELLKDRLGSRRMSCAGAILLGNTAGAVGLSERRRPAARACLQMWSCCTSCCPQPLFIVDERRTKLMMVV